MLDLGAANCRLNASIKFCACAKFVIGSHVASSIENPFHLTCTAMPLTEIGKKDRCKVSDGSLCFSALILYLSVNKKLAERDGSARQASEGSTSERALPGIARCRPIVDQATFQLRIQPHISPAHIGVSRQHIDTHISRLLQLQCIEARQVGKKH